jgi:hypothetical protein
MNLDGPEELERLTRLADLGDQGAKERLVCLRRRRGEPHSLRLGHRWHWSRRRLGELARFLRRYGEGMTEHAQAFAETADRIAFLGFGWDGTTRGDTPYIRRTPVITPGRPFEPPPRRYARQTVEWLRSRERAHRGRERGWVALPHRSPRRRRCRKRA